MNKQEEAFQIKLNFIKENHTKMSNQELADYLGCTRQNIVDIKVKYNLTKRKEVAEPLEDEYFVSMQSINYSNYFISNKGRVKNLKGNIIQPFYKGNEYNPNNRYVSITLHDDNHNKHNELVHRLVAMIFIPNSDPANKIEVNHKDGNRQNNNIENLEWVTPVENMKHANDNNLINYLRGEQIKVSKFKEFDVRLVCELLQKKTHVSKIHELYPQYSTPWIRTIKRREIWTHISQEYQW